MILKFKKLMTTALKKMQMKKNLWSEPEVDMSYKLHHI
jgi:hypothetical protein